MTLPYLYFCHPLFPTLPSSHPLPTDSLSSPLHHDYCSNFWHHQFSYSLWHVFKGCLLLPYQFPYNFLLKVGMRKRHCLSFFLNFFIIDWFVDLSSRKQSQFWDWSTQICMFYHFSNVIQNKISLDRNVTQNCVIGCLTYWSDHWAEAGFSSLLARMYPHLTLKVMKIKYRKTSWDSEILFFPSCRNASATMLSNKTVFSIYLAQRTCYFFYMVTELVLDFHMSC